MGTLLSILGNSFFGSLLGGVFSWLNKREETAELRVKNEHDEKMLGLQNAQALSLADKAMQTTVVAGRVAVDVKEADAFVAAQATAFIPSGSALLDGILRLVRPVITVYLLAVMTYFAVKISALVGGLKAFDSATLLGLYGEVVSEAFFLTNLAVSFWFGSRGSSKRLEIPANAQPKSA